MVRAVVITLDTSGLYALCNRRDPDHARAREVLLADPGPAVVPAGILGEVCYLLEQRLGLATLRAFLSDLDSGLYVLDCGEKDLARVSELVYRYADLPLGFSDAAVVACAERRGGRVLTFDHRHFRVVEKEGRIQVVP